MRQRFQDALDVRILPWLWSWVTSLKHMQELVERLDRWGVHPEVTCTERLPLSEASRAYELADRGQTGKVCLVLE